eukprot:TRINITY_DN13071_c0_g1_i1.p1 TRINITY_DN13071_c0_g1~~TRINITY_DN13071_c0_g1_i1.p1  ORF type:complete len:220 (-),score=29.53 TRINITY_DN13071_c0_g1_i1:249-908(-)
MVHPLVHILKCVLIGDSEVGKTSLLISYTENRFPEENVPTVYDNITTAIDLNGKYLNLSLWDTVGQDEYSKLRSLTYPDTDVFLVCFSLVYPPSLHNVEDKWLPELSRLCPGANIVLVGTKLDLRENAIKNKRPVVTFDEGDAVAKRAGVTYIECSALMRTGIKTAFEEGFKLALDKPSSNAGSQESNPDNRRHEKTKVMKKRASRRLSRRQTVLCSIQ